MFGVIRGTIEHIRDRIICINGFTVMIPERGAVYIGIALVPHEGAVIPRVCELSGPSAPRFCFMLIGDMEFKNIAGMCEQHEAGVVPFQFAVFAPRPKVSVN